MINNNLKFCRESLEMTQKELGYVFGVAESTVSGWENNNDIMPLTKLVKFCDLYGFSLDYVTGLTRSNYSYSKINKLDKIKIGIYTYDNLNSFRIENGFAMGDLIWEITKLIRYNKEISVDVKNKCFKTLKEMDYLDNIGGNEKIILSNLISLIRNI